MITLLSSTDGQRVYMQIQACFLHLEYRQLKASGRDVEERLETIQDILRRNQFGVLYYRHTEEQLMEELARLKKVYLGKNGSYRFFIS